MIPKIQNAHDPATRNIINAAIDSINTQGKSIQDLVAEGQLTPSQYAELVSIVNGNVKKGNITTADIDKNNFAIDQTMITDGLRSIITGNAPINAVPANNSLTTDKFVNESVTKSKRTVGGGLALVTFRGAKPNLNLTSGERGLEMNRDFTIFHEKGSADFAAGIKIEFAAGHNTLILYDVKAQTFRGLNGQYMHLVSDDEVIIADIQFQDQSQNAVQQVVASFDYTVEGMSSTEADSITHRELSDSSVTESKTNFIEVPNYFNKDDVTIGKSIDRTTGEERDLANNSLSNKIQITGEITLYLKNISIIACYDKNDEHLIGWVPNSLSTTFTTHKDTEYIRVSARNDYLDIAMVYKGTEEKPYEPFGVKILGVDIAKDESGNESNTIEFPPESIEAKFIAPEYEYQQMTLEEYYTAFDELVNKYPDNLKKKICGKDMSGQYDVIQYHYIPTTYTYESTRVDRPKPKITFISNIHGFERPTALSTYYMIKSMLEDWRTNDAIEYLRSNVEMVFIAIANPYGYVNSTYKNGNPNEPVNIQTNFPINFLEQDPASNAYGGTEPMSEKETQYISQMLHEHSDALFFVDSHSAGSVATQTPENMFYFIGPSQQGLYNEIIEESMKNSVENLTRELSKYYLHDFEGVSGYYYLRPGNGTTEPYAASLGIPGYVSELFYSLPDDESAYQPTAIKAMTETFANTLLTTLKTFKERM